MLVRIARKAVSTSTRRYTAAAAPAPSAQGTSRTGLIAAAVTVASVFSLYTYAQKHKATAAQKTALDPKNFLDFKVSKVSDVNHNTKLVTIALDPDQKLGLPTASCVVVKIPGVNDAEGKPIIRPYTPLDGDSTGYTQFVIKKYKDGKLTPHVHNLKPGDTISIKGPIAKYPYTANTKKHIGLVAGGTGLAPMLQVADAILSNPNDKTEVTFVFANIAEEDILLRKEIDERAKKHKNFKVHYVLEKPPKGWTGSTGYISKELLQKTMPAPSNDNLVMVCGPPGMMKAISGTKAPDFTQGEVDGILKDLGYTKDQIYKF